MEASAEWARDLQAFVAVAEHASFTLAAEALYLSQPAVSKQVQGLEARLRAPLFVRRHRSVSLTPAGEALLPHALRVLGSWQEGVSAVRAATAQQLQTVTVGFHTRIGRGLLPALRDALAVALPGWQLAVRQVSWADPSAGLGDGTVDVAVAWLPVGAAGVAYRVAATEARWVALPANHRLAPQEEVAFHDLLGEPFVALPGLGPMRDFWLAEADRPSPARVSTVAANAEEAFEAVAGGLGVVLLSEGNAALYERPDVVSRPVTGIGPCELAVMWRAEDHREAVAVLGESVCRCVSGDGLAPRV